MNVFGSTTKMYNSFCYVFVSLTTIDANHSSASACDSTDDTLVLAGDPDALSSHRLCDRMCALSDWRPTRSAAGHR
jgi:hypothetical protein